MGALRTQDLSRARPLLVGLLLTTSLACGGKRAKPRAVRAPVAQAAAPTSADASRAGKDAAELLRATHLPSATLLGAVGAHKLTLKSHVAITAEQPETLDEDTTLEVAGDGQFHLLHLNSRDYGQDVVLSGGNLFVRPRYGKYVRRPPEPGEPERLRDEALGTLAAYLDVVGFALEAKGGKATTAAGRPALEVALGQGAGKAPAASDDFPERKWRETVVPVSIEGSVTLDQATGVPLAADVHLRYKHTRAGQTVETALALTLAVEAGATVAAPAQGTWVDVPVRERPVLERDQLLGIER